MNHVKFIFLFLCLNSAVVFSAFNTGLEIQLIDYTRFNGYYLQYNFQFNDENKWTPLELKCNETSDNIKYCCSSLYIKNDNKRIYIRIFDPVNLKVSDVSYFPISPGKTNFLKLNRVLNELPYATPSQAVLGQNNLLKYYQAYFRTKNYTYYMGKAILISPRSNIFKGRLGIINFRWQLTRLVSGVRRIFLGIFNANEEKIYNINVGNSEEFSFDLSEYALPSGEYSWQIIVEDLNTNKYYSEMRPFFIVDNISEGDDDGDGYSNTEELLRGSDPYDSSDFPLGIISTNVCKNAIVGLQYFLKLDANLKKSIKWNLLGVLPEGLSLNDHGVIYGKPNVAGDYEFSVEAYDDFGKSDEKRLFLQVIDQSPSEVKTGRGYTQ